MKKFLIPLALSMLLLGDSGAASAQKMITFESHDGPSSSHKRHTGVNGKNSVTIGLVSWINGYTPVYFERAIGSHFSVQIGAGFTSRSYLNDFGMLVWNDGKDNSDRFKGNDDVEDHYENYKFRKTLIGPYFSIAPKVYFHPDDLMNGAYVSPMLEYKSYQFEAQKADITEQADNYYSNYDDRDIPHTKEKVNEHMNCLDFTINIGGHFQTGSHLAVGWSVGLGARHISSERLDIGKLPDSNGNYYYANNITGYSKTKPLFTFGFTMGGWF